MVKYSLVNLTFFFFTSNSLLKNPCYFTGYAHRICKTLPVLDHRGSMYFNEQYMTGSASSRMNKT